MLLSDALLHFHSDFELTRGKSFSARTIFSGWFDYLRIGLPGAMMLCFEWWAFEILAVISGWIGVQALAAEVIIINIVSFIFMIPLGIACAASALTGINIG